MIKKLCDMIKQFLSGEYEPLEFSFEFPDAVIDCWEAGEKENPEIMEIFDDKIPEICADFERGADPKLFREKIIIEYDRAMKFL